ncbi:unnamed protein product [Urochloa decumbens]|uniref:DUF1618 domain-containing protein n=1 Tax=Urochloa decumbens TaxID=240449 RepID=A0ABC9DSM9_9POAL
MDRCADWMLLKTIAVVGRNSNVPTATGCTRYGKTIEVSLSLEHPPRPSILHVYSSRMNPSVPPNIICTVEDLLLFSVNTGSGPYSLSPDDCDYFIYRAHTSGPSLELLQRPHPYFNCNDIGLLPRSDGQYTVAVLIPTISLDQFDLHLYHSDSKKWSSRTLPVKAPQQPFPVKIPPGSARLHRHLSSSVITIGGKDGTIGWVDHWRGILLCDLLNDENKLSLRGVPIPLPLEELSCTNEDFPSGPGVQRRGIVYIRDKGLKLVHLEITATQLPHKDPETDAISFNVENWAITTWSNKHMTNLYKDWHKECTVKASDITIDNPAVSQVLESGLLMRNNGDSGEQLALQNIPVSQPTHCVNGKDVVYLVARKKYKHLRAWIVAVDMKNGKVQAVEEFGTQKDLGSSIIYYPSIISKYMMTPPPGCFFPISSKETHKEQLHVGLKPSYSDAEESNDALEAWGGLEAA